MSLIQSAIIMPRRAVYLSLCVVIGALLWQARASGRADSARAMWLWNPSPMLTSADARAAFFDFLDHEHITVVWAQVGTEGPNLKFAAEWRRLIAEATRRRVKIEALDGAPTYAIQEEIPKRVVESVLAYNESADPDQRFSGIHFDIEPYLLWAWRSPQGRQQVLRRYLDLLQWCRRRMDNEFPGMKLGVDIPFWWQSTDARTGRAIGDVAFNGETKAASFHVIDMLDNVGIMNYRNRAAGPNGMVALGEDLLVYADRARKTAIWMGVETSRDDASPVWFAIGLPKDVAAVALEAADITPDRQYKSFKLTAFDDGASVHLGLGLRGMDPARPSAAFMSALAELARTLGVLSRPGPADRGDQSRARAMRSLAADPEWQKPTARTIVDPETGKEYPGVVADNVMLAILTFEGSPLEVFRRELAAADAAFAKHPSYRGLAIHHYESYRALVNGAGPMPSLIAIPTAAAPRY